MSIFTFANMPGSSTCLGLATVASTCTLRVAESTLGLIALILPLKAWPGKVSTDRFTTWPTSSPASCCCGSEKST
jgi:hypothetical protein